MAAAAPADGGLVLLLALFLLGWGWNLGFVAGSAMLSQNVELHERTRVQGVSDALIWSCERRREPRLGAHRGGRRLHGPRHPGRGPDRDPGDRPAGPAPGRHPPRRPRGREIDIVAP